MVHELGHCLDLAHTSEGIMGSGFADIQAFFGILNQECLTDERLLCQETKEERLKLKDDLCPHQPVGKDLLKAFRNRQQKNIQLKRNGRAFWSRSCAVILAHHKSVPHLQSVKLLSIHPFLSKLLFAIFQMYNNINLKLQRVIIMLNFN